MSKKINIEKFVDYGNVANNGSTAMVVLDNAIYNAVSVYDQFVPKNDDCACYDRDFIHALATLLEGKLQLTGLFSCLNSATFDSEAFGELEPLVQTLRKRREAEITRKAIAEGRRIMAEQKKKKAAAEKKHKCCCGGKCKCGKHK